MGQNPLPVCLVVLPYHSVRT